ncbi:unnamed protein product [Ascophyllum nodosum]
MRAAAVARSWAWMAATRAWHSRSSVWAVSPWPRKTESLEMRGAATRSCSAAAEAATWVRARPSSTSWMEGRARSARCCAERVSQM